MTARSDSELFALHAEMALERGVMRAGGRVYAGGGLSWSLGADATLEDWERELDPLYGPLTLRSGPLYVFDAAPRIDTDAAIVSSDRVEPSLRGRNPGNWDADEWQQLLDGTLGPWAMAIVGNAVVSIAHTPRAMTEAAAECGVWTARGHRGRGYAAATAAAWADLLRPSGRALFYATAEDNVSSQRVAARLGLRRLGETTTLERARTSSRHPLSDGARGRAGR